MLPELNYKQNTIEMLNAFLGLNKKYKINDAEFAETHNMTNDYYPVLGNRQKRGILKSLSNLQGMLGGRYLAYVDDNKLYYNEQFVKDLEATDKERQLVVMGAYLCVFPDKIIYNTYTDEISDMENEVVTTTNPTFTLCKLDGTNFDSSNTITSNNEPSDKTKYWIDTSQDTVVIKIYSSSSSAWVSVGTTYIKVEAPDIGKGFKAYDACLFEDVDLTASIYNGIDLNQTNIIYDRGDDFLVIAGLINQVFTNSKPITVKRVVPDMDFVCELDNRIWGCSSDKHEIYSCKLGDATNWNFFAGLDSDSYAATVGTEDIFTGAIAYSGYAFFFKENGYHKVYGSKPSNYEIIWKPCRGVQKGSEKSLAVVNEVLMYKSRDAVCMFDGNVEKISDNLGYLSMYGAVGGTYRDKYYLSMRDADYNFGLFVFDTTKGTWIQEDSIELKFAATANGGLYIVDRNNQMYVVNNEKIYIKFFPEETLYPSETVYPGDSIIGEIENEVEWSFTTGDIGDNSPYHKYIKRIDIRMWLDISAYMKIEIMYDSSDAWMNVMEYYSTRKRSFDMPISIQRCDHFRLRISGKGDVRLYSIAKVTEQGTDSGGDTNA